MALSFSEEMTPWTPLAPVADPAAAARPEVRALSAFWRRVRADIAEVLPEAAERLTKRQATVAGVAKELLDVLEKPLSIPMLQELHVVATRDQTAARVMVTDGSYRYVAFPYGKLKDRPNHLNVSGRIQVEFCPPDQVVGELEKLLRFHEAIPAELTEVRAAWLVHALLRVHPFVDGNGRASRVLANWNFLRDGLPAVWSEHSERGGGWADALDEAQVSFDLAPITALLASHQERLVARLLLEAEDAPPRATLDETLAHGTALAGLRPRWADGAAAAAAQIPALAALAHDALAELGRRLGEAGEVTTELGTGRAVWTAARGAGLVTDRYAQGALVTLRGGRRPTSIGVGIAPFGTAGTGVLSAFVRLRPRSPISRGVAPLTLWPDESPAERIARFSEWLPPALAEAAAMWIRLA